MFKHTHTWVHTFDDAIADRSGVTELSKLTSDPFCTEDRRGRVLISSSD